MSKYLASFESFILECSFSYCFQNKGNWNPSLAKLCPVVDNAAIILYSSTIVVVAVADDTVCAFEEDEEEEEVAGSSMRTSTLSTQYK